MHRQWLVSKTNAEFLRYLSQRLSISNAFSQILINRGLTTQEAIKEFLNPSLDNLQDPYLLPDMDKAVQRLKSAIRNNEGILVHGDYDADGLTATALMVSTLRSLGLKPLYHIPDRLKDGYGFNKDTVEMAKAYGIGLIMTVDCGITAFDEVLMAKALGIDVIITDHHEPSMAGIPDAFAVVNPKREDCRCKFKELSGVGVAFKIAQALLQDSSNHSDAYQLLDIVALGTVADIVPLVSDNRVVVTHGLNAIDRGERVGIKAMLEASGFSNREINTGLLSFSLIPRINAMGRIANASAVVELLLSDDIDRAIMVASELDEKNRERQRIEETVYQEALSMLEGQDADGVIVLSSENWHPGVIGIVASRIAESFFRPTFLFSIKDGIAKGSARSIPAFHLYNALEKCQQLLIAYGGHKQAAGLRMQSDKLHAFKRTLNSIFMDSINKEDLSPRLNIDASIELQDINLNLCKEIALLEPFGTGNEEPILGARGLEILYPRIVGNNHLKMKLRQRFHTVDTIGFDMGDMLERLQDTKVDAAFTPCINNWEGGQSLQLNLKGIRPYVD